MGLPGIIGASGIWSGGVRLTPAELTTAILALGGSELIEWYLAEDLAQFRTLGTGVATWIGQKSAINATQATGSQQPAMEATSGPNGRGRLNFTAASSQFLRTATSFAVGAERWGLLAMVQPKSAGVSSQRHAQLGTTSALRLALERATASSGWASRIQGNGGASNLAVGADDDTSPHLHEAWCTSPHSGVLDGASVVGSSTQVHLGASSALTVGANGAASPTQILDGYVSCVGVFKAAGTAVPSWVPDARTLIRSYYGI